MSSDVWCLVSWGVSVLALMALMMYAVIKDPKNLYPMYGKWRRYVAIVTFEPPHSGSS